jgi:hypothetical protein
MKVSKNCPVNQILPSIGWLAGFAGNAASFVSLINDAPAISNASFNGLLLSDRSTDAVLLFLPISIMRTFRPHAHSGYCP